MVERGIALDRADVNVLESDVRTSTHYLKKYIGISEKGKLIVEKSQNRRELIYEYSIGSLYNTRGRGRGVLI